MLVAVPLGVVTLTLPVFAPDGTVAWIRVGVSTAKLVAFTPPKVTFVAPTNPPPTIPTSVPTGPEEGSRFVMMGRMCMFC